MPAIGSLVGLLIFAAALAVLFLRHRQLERRVKTLSEQRRISESVSELLGDQPGDELSRHRLRRAGGSVKAWTGTVAGAIGLTALWRRRELLLLAGAAGAAGFMLSPLLMQAPSAPDGAEPAPTVTVTVTATMSATVTATATVTETVEPRPVSETRTPEPEPTAIVAGEAPRGGAPDRPRPTAGPGSGGGGGGEPPTDEPPPPDEPPSDDGQVETPQQRCLLAADAEVDSLARLRLRALCD